MPARKQPPEDGPRSLLAAAAARMNDNPDEPVDVRRPAEAQPAAPAPSPEPPAPAAPSAPSWAAPAASESASSPPPPPPYQPAAPQYQPPPPGSAPPPLPGYGGVPPVPQKKKSGVKTALIAGGAALGGLIALLIILGFVVSSQEDETDIDDLPRVETPILGPEVLYTPVAGYALEDPPPDLLQAVREPFDQDPVVARSLRDMSARAITEDGDLAALVFVFQFTNDFSAAGDAAFESFARGFKEEAEDSDEVRVGGHRGLFFTLDNGVSGFAVMKGSIVVMVEGNVSRAELQRLTEQFLSRVP